MKIFLKIENFSYCCEIASVHVEIRKVSSVDTVVFEAIRVQTVVVQEQLDDIAARSVNESAHRCVQNWLEAFAQQHEQFLGAHVRPANAHALPFRFHSYLRLEIATNRVAAVRTHDRKLRIVLTFLFKLDYKN